MRFGKIDYLNLLPFYVFVKKSHLPSSFKASMHRNIGTPSLINEMFLKKEVEAAFISSIKSKNKECFDVGIIAKKSVWSVLLRAGESRGDMASATSNVLASVLGLSGEVIIGDRALSMYLKNPGAYIDLAGEWNRKFRLPFTFARFCCNKKKDFYKNIADSFAKSHIKIPRYILDSASQRSGIEPKMIVEYLKRIEYKMDKKSKMGLKKFLDLARMIT